MEENSSWFCQTIEPSLITRAQHGDLRAHEAIFNLYSKQVLNLAFRLCNQKEMAEDVLQNTFIKVIAGIDSFPHQAPFGMWLRKIAVNEALMILRKNRQAPQLVSFEDQDTFDNVVKLDLQTKQQDCSIHQYQVQSTLQRTLAQLPAQTRMVLWLKEVEGYNHLEIAELMGMSESFSKSLISRAFTRLRTCFTSGNKTPLEKP